MKRGNWAVALFLPLPFSSCSLMGLDDFGVGPCVTDLDCKAALEQASPYPSRCGSYLCEQGVCAWHDGVERCNGEDDTCDGIIDEGIPVEPRPASSGPRGTPASVAYASIESISTTYVAVPGVASVGTTLTLDGMQSMQPLRYDSALAGIGSKCPSTELGQAVATACNFADVAMAVDAYHLVFASINTFGCDAGQVRIGLSNPQTDPYAVWLGKTNDAKTEEQSNIAFGVDVGPDRCTGASRQATATGIPAVGARSPAVASLGTTAGAPGALAVWLAARMRSDDGQRTVPCASTEAAVEALGVFVRDGEPDWLDGTDGGNPITLSQTTSLSAPAVVALPLAAGPGSYLVAFAGEDGGARGVQLVSVQSFDAHLHFSLIDFIRDETGPDRVSLALGGTGKEGLEVGMVWSSGCGPDTKLKFAIVSPIRVPALLAGPLSIDAPNLLFRPQLLYRAQGFSTNEPRGGWFLLWPEDGSETTRALRLARVAGIPPAALNDVTIRSGAIGFPLVYPRVNAGAGFSHVRQDEGGQPDIETLDGWCH